MYYIGMVDVSSEGTMWAASRLGGSDMPWTGLQCIGWDVSQQG